jgi:hypothetical protein
MEMNITDTAMGIGHANDATARMSATTMSARCGDHGLT